jgi:hypothetical protein
MVNQIPKTYQLADGWYWEIFDESNGPFQTEDEAINNYVDNHECEEE